MLAEDLIWPKMQGRSPCNQVGWEKNIFLINFTFSKIYSYTWLFGWDLHPRERAVKEERFPYPVGGGCASSAVRSAGTERASVAQRRCSSWTVAGRTETASGTEGPDRLTAVPSPGTHVCWWLSLWCWMFDTINKTTRDKNFGFCTRILAINTSDACLSGNSYFKWPSYSWIFLLL